MQEFYKTSRQQFCKVWPHIKKDVEAIKSNWGTFKKDSVPLVIIWGKFAPKIGNEGPLIPNEIIAVDITIGENEEIWVSKDYYHLTGSPIPSRCIYTTYRSFLNFCCVKFIDK